MISSAFEKILLYIRSCVTTIFPYRYRLVYSNIELIEKEDEIKHPSIRNVIKFFGNPKDLEISHTEIFQRGRVLGLVQLSQLAYLMPLAFILIRLEMTVS